MMVRNQNMEQRTPEVILNSIGDAVITTDVAGRIVLLNPMAEQLTGWTNEEARGLSLESVFQIINAETRQPMVNPVAKVLSTGNVVGLANHTILLRKTNDYEIQISDNAAPIRAESGEITGVVLVFRDVTEEYALLERLSESEERYRDIFLNTPSVKLLMDPDTGQILEANPAACSFYGYSFEQLTRLKIWEINLFGEAKTREILSQIKQGKLDYETRHRLASGEIRSVRVLAGAIKNPRKTFIHAVVIDVTEQKRAEYALRESEQKFKLIAENTSDGILVFNAHNELIYYSPSFVIQLGLGVEPGKRLSTEDITNRIHPEDFPSLQNFLQHEIANKTQSLVYSYRFLHGKGHYVHREDNTRLNYDSEGNYTGAYVVSRDITERIRDKELLRENALRIQRHAEAIAWLACEPSITTGDLNTALPLITKTAAQVLQIDRVGIWLKNTNNNSNFTCISSFDTVPNSPLGVGSQLNPQEYPRYFEELRKHNIFSIADALHDHRTTEFQKAYLPLLNVTAFLDAGINMGGKLVGVICCEHRGGIRPWQPDEEAFVSTLATLTVQALENAERRRAEEALRANELILNEAQRIAKLGSYEIELSDGIIKASPNFLRIFAFDPATTHHIDELEARLHPDDHDRCMDYFQYCVANRMNYNTEYRIVLPDGQTRWISSISNIIYSPEGKPLRIQGIKQDITEKRRAEQELEKMNKLESIGTLAGGIAHDFNNILTGIFANISLALAELHPSHSAYECLQEAEHSINRATRLTKQLLTFAKGGDPIKETASLSELLKEVARFDLSGSSIKPLFAIPNGLWNALVDKGQIQQVFSNLIINAKQAMPKGGTLRISLENLVLNDSKLPSLKPGEYLKATIADEGIGIDPQHLSRIFDPYFTTKSGGNGLGLATVYSIVTKHGGHIEVASQVGKGTTFTVYLPAVHHTPSPVNRKKTKSSSPILPLFHNKRILVLDDEEAILNVCRRMLERNGFQVETVMSGEQAIGLFKQYQSKGNPFDLVLMDLTLPGGLSGCETAKELLQIEPGLRCIVSSGYAEDPIIANYREHGFSGFINKPYTISQLLDVLERVLKG
ncbi:MAG: PAS domain S-box protein [Candidatus Sumerlaeia bacterium]|nr:PAS domain S-box protein [Candidatus Sumerlaeia bacterium]